MQNYETLPGYMDIDRANDVPDPIGDYRNSDFKVVVDEFVENFEQKKKKKTKGAPGSGTRKGKATRTAHGKQGQADIGKALKKGFNKVGELVRKGGDWLEKGNEGKPSPYIGLEKRYKTKEEWRKDQKKKK